VGLGLELVLERVELRRLARTVRERLRQQPVRQPRVSGEQWPVEVGTDHAARATALVAARSVVPEAGEYATERMRVLASTSPIALAHSRDLLVPTTGN